MSFSLLFSFNIDSNSIFFILSTNNLFSGDEGGSGEYFPMREDLPTASLPGVKVSGFAIFSMLVLDLSGLVIRNDNNLRTFFPYGNSQADS